MRTITTSTVLAAILLLAACGDAGTATPGTLPDTLPGTVPDTIGDPPSTDPGRPPTIDDIEIDPDAPPAGPLFGNASASREAPRDVRDPMDGGQVVEPDEVDPQTTCLSEDDCGPGALPPVDPFVPLPEHQPFCGLLAEIEERPYPEDEYEQLVVTQAWLQELRAVTPTEIGDPMDVVIAVIDGFVRSQDVDLDDIAFDDGSDLLVAVEHIEGFIESSC